jgi:hypothetical protein
MREFCNLEEAAQTARPFVMASVFYTRIDIAPLRSPQPGSLAHSGEWRRFQSQARLRHAMY